MNVADLPASLTITNLGSRDLGIANIIVPASGQITVDLSSMGPARKCDVWLTAHAARLASLVSTSPVTEAIDDAWYSAHHYRAPPPLHTNTGGQDDLTAGGSGQHVINGGQGENYAPEGSGPAPGGDDSLDFSNADNSQYVAVISFI